MNRVKEFRVGMRVIRLTGGDRIGNQGEIIEIDGARVRVKWDTEKLRTWIKSADLDFITALSIAACNDGRLAYIERLIKKSLR